MQHNPPDLDFTAALLYPYRKGNRLNTWLVPLLLLILPGLLLDSYASEAVLAPALWVLLSWLSGFYWHLSGTFKARGLLAPAPGWISHWRVFLRDGLKLFPYVFLINMLVLVIGRIPVFQPLWQPMASQEAAVAIIFAVILLIYTGPLIAAPLIDRPELPPR